MTDQTIVTVLTIMVISANLANAIRAFYYALKIEAKCKWACTLGSRYRGIHILCGVGVISMILVLLKSWSIGDIFIPFWYNMPESYHTRSYAFLAENMGVALLGWQITNFIRNHAICKDGKDKPSEEHCEYHKKE